MDETDPEDANRMYYMLLDNMSMALCMASISMVCVTILAFMVVDYPHELCIFNNVIGIIQVCISVILVASAHKIVNEYSIDIIYGLFIFEIFQIGSIVARAFDNSPRIIQIVFLTFAVLISIFTSALFIIFFVDWSKNNQEATDYFRVAAPLTLSFKCLNPLIGVFTAYLSIDDITSWFELWRTGNRQRRLAREREVTERERIRNQYETEMVNIEGALNSVNTTVSV